MPALNASVALIEPDTEAATATFTLSHGEVPARLSASGLATAEAIPVSTIDGPDDVETAVMQGGVALELSEDDTMLVLTAPGVYKVAKPTTAGDVGVFLAKG